MSIASRTLAALCGVLLSCCTLLAQEDKSLSPSPARTTAAPTITMTATAERVRFTAPASVVRMHLEVYSEAGETLFDGQSKGNVFDWSLADGSGARVAEGSYLCVVTVKALNGGIRQRLGTVTVQGEEVSVRGATASQLSVGQQQAIGPVEENAALTVLTETDSPSATVVAHNGREGQVTSTVGALSFRTGDFFSGRDREQMRLTEEGNLGIGTDSPQVRLDVNGMIRARSGFQFSDGSVLNLAPQGTGLRVTLPSGGTARLNFAPDAVAGTANYIPRFASDGSSLLDSVIYQNPSNGFIGIGTTTPAHPFVVRRNGGSLGVHSLGELFVDRDNNTRSASLTVGTAGTLKWIFGMPSGNDGFQVFDLINFQSRFYVHPTSGNIGMGTTLPSGRLEVNRDWDGNYGALTLSGSRPTIRFSGGAAAGNHQWLLHLTSSNSNTGSLQFYNGGTNGDFVAPMMSLSPSGNVGIGTSIPSAKLDVRGDIKLGLNGEYQAVSGEENLRIVRGVIREDGQIIVGSGFTVEKGSAGRYAVVFNTPFAAPPTVTITPRYFSDASLTAGALDGVTASFFSAVTQTYGEFTGQVHNTDMTFHFIAIGPR